MRLWVEGSPFPPDNQVRRLCVTWGSACASLVWEEVCRTVHVDFRGGQTKMQRLHSSWHFGRVTGKNLHGLRNAGVPAAGQWVKNLTVAVRVAAVAWVRSPTWELPYAMGAPPPEKKAKLKYSLAFKAKF